MPRGVSLSNFDAVLFDVDGTLIDSLEMIIRGLGDTYEKYLGTRPDRDTIQSLIGMPLSLQLRLFRLAEPSPSELQEMTEFTIARFAAHRECQTTFPAAVSTLRLCHAQGLKTALVTSKSDVELDEFLAIFEAATCVTTTVCASDVSNPKPAPESALLACRKLGVEPRQSVLIGDSVYDMRCGKDAGVRTIAVSYGAGERSALAAEHPDLVFESPEDLLSWAESAFLEPTCRGRS